MIYRHLEAPGEINNTSNILELENYVSLDVSQSNSKCYNYERFTDTLIEEITSKNQDDTD